MTAPRILLANEALLSGDGDVHDPLSAAVLRPESPPGEAIEARRGDQWPITDAAVAIGGAIDSDKATGLTSIAHRVAGVIAFARS